MLDFRKFLFSLFYVFSIFSIMNMYFLNQKNKKNFSLKIGRDPFLQMGVHLFFCLTFLIWLKK